MPTVSSFMDDRYLPHIRDRLRSHGTVAVFCRRIGEAIGRRALDEVTQADVASFRRRLMGTGLSNASVNRHLATLRAMFYLAIKWQIYQGPNPAASPGMLPETSRDVYLSPQETQALVRALDLEPNREAAAALMLLIVTGARKREIIHARWEHVDFRLCQITIARSKSGRKRYVPLSAIAVKILMRQYQRRRPADGGFVFPGKVEGTPLEDLRGPWKRAKEHAGLLPSMRVHDLRHSFASVLANQGVPLNEIGIILGHSQLSTTARYAHHSPQRLIQTASIAARTWDLLEGPGE